MRGIGWALILLGIVGCRGSQSEEPDSSQEAPAVVSLDQEPTRLPPKIIRTSKPPDPLPRLIATIKGRGGKVSHDGSGLTAIDWHRAPINNLDLELLTDTPSLKRLYLSGTKIDSRGWVYLSALPNLERLALWKSPFADEDLKYLAQAKNLQVLDLSHTQITGTGVGYLEDCQNLETLILKPTDLKLEAFEQIALLKSLRILDIRERNFPGSQIRPLKALPNLEELQIDFCDPEILRELAEFPNIRRLDLTRPFTQRLKEQFSAIGKMQKLESITYSHWGNQDEFLKHISKCPNLREIRIVSRGSGRRRPQFTDQGLANLTACRSLRMLDVREASVTLGGLRQIAQANPNVRILVHPITLHGLQRAFRSMGLGAKHSHDGGPRLQVDREMNITALRLEDARIFLPSLKLIGKAIDPEKLEHLGLGHTELTDEGLANFRAGVHLKHLNLSHTKITTDGLKKLGGGQYPELPYLETLDLSGTTLDDDCLKWIATLDRLKTLRLKDVKGITKEGWASLRQLPSLKTLEK